ncbi:helix-turn-helix transcriptional regulator [Vallitalea okinawensis]|uniref:helix-turn-helix transcriptional regulator n=1 Tax=Vallitalea okinawensis TaxID=2078660 RepID=UPI0013006070|nr:helix-turn-helix transcriptional regulator [Vallitalea okinawensis]
MELIKYPLFHSLFNNLKLSLYLNGHLNADSKWQYYYLDPAHRLYYITKGSAYFYKESPNEKYLLKKGHIYLLPRRQLYGLGCDHYMEKFFFHFDLQLVPGLDVFDCFNDYISMPFYSQDLYNLTDLASQQDLKSTLLCKSILWETLAYFLEPHTDYLLKHAKKIKKYESLCSYLDSNCHFGITVKDLANTMNISPSYLSRVFKKDMGITIKEFVNAHLLDQAKKELIFTDKSIRQVAADLRFNDEFYFSNYFKRHTNCSPKYYQHINSVYGK